GRGGDQTQTPAHLRGPPRQAEMGPFLKALRPHAPSNAGRSGASRRPLARPRSATDPLGSPAISGRAPRGPPAQFASEQSIEASPRLPLQSKSPQPSAVLPQRFQERTHFRLAWRTPQVRRCLCLIAAAAALISTNEWRRGACHSRIKPLLAACVCAVGMWATRLRCPSEAAYPQPAGDSAVGSAAPGGGAGGRLNRFVDKS